MVDINAVHRAFSFLDLPGELRNKIYRYLLNPYNVEHYNPVIHYELEPVLLRLNRQIHQETRSILYDENFWIVVVVNVANYPVVDAFHPEQISKRECDRHLPIVSSGDFSRIRDPVLRVTASFGPNRQGETSKFLLPLCGIHRLCRRLWVQSKNLSHHRHDVSLALDIQLRRQPGFSDQKMHDLLLAPFAAVRGIQEATISGDVIREETEKLCQSMRTDFFRVEEIVEVLHGFLDKGKRARELGNSRAAFVYLRKAHQFGMDLASCTHRTRLVTRARVEGKYPLLKHQKAMMNLHGAWTCIDVGSYYIAVEALGASLSSQVLNSGEQAFILYLRAMARCRLGVCDAAKVDLAGAMEMDSRNTNLRWAYNELEKYGQVESGLSPGRLRELGLELGVLGSFWSSG
ncbi:MAG: hypothetical protein M1812_004078 [Candelaria pacifica]|nr:MAG: hypothetical protein M1812_004078 [Candelaria pacifica]